MKNDEILSQIAHRPWRLPSKSWRYYQEWNNTVFLHWKVDYKDLIGLVPQHLEVEQCNGDAWVSIVAFTMENVRLRGLPSFSPISNFHEVNIRTYVRYNGKSGVYFLSIEGAKWLSCKIAKTMSGLPYRHSPMKRSVDQFESKNKGNGSGLDLRYSVGDVIDHKEELDLWLTERYALFQDTKLGTSEFEIHHVPWSIFKVHTLDLNVHYPRFQKFFMNKPDVTHYSSGVQVLAWNGKLNK